MEMPANLVQQTALRFDGIKDGSVSLAAGVVHIKELINSDIIVKYLDEADDGLINRGGILVTTAHTKNAFRTGEVIMVGKNDDGTDISYVKTGDKILFPDNVGLTLSKVLVGDCPDFLSKVVFLSKEKIFCKIN